MSPEILVNEKLILDAPDLNGDYQTDGYGEIGVDLSLLHPARRVNEIVLRGDAVKGREGSSAQNGVRRIQLNRKGEGSQTIRKGEVWKIKLKDSSLVAKHIKPKREWQGEKRSLYML